MKALCIIIASYVCLCSCQQSNWYPELYPNYVFYKYTNHDVDNRWWQNNKDVDDGQLSPYFLPQNLRLNSYNRLNAQVLASDEDSNNGKQGDVYARQTKEAVNLHSQPVDKNYAGNEVLRNNGIQNNLSLNNRRYGSDVDDNQSLRNNNNPLAGHIITSTVTTHLPSQMNLLESPQPLWNNQPSSFPSKPVDINSNPYVVSPDFNDNNDWNHPEPNDNECYYLKDIINDLHLLFRIRNISEEKHNLKMLFKIIKMFVLNNNLQYAPLSVVVREIGRSLLNGNNDSNNLRENDLRDVVQEFKNRELNHFLQDISLHRETNIQTAVPKLALLLYRLKQILIHKGFPENTVALVINRLVQWSVPLVGYYFEKDCKIKTQQYILQSLQLALNLNLDNIKHIGRLDDLQVDFNYGSPDNSGSQGNLWEIGNSGSLAQQGTSDNVVNVALPSPINVGVLENLGDQGYNGNPGSFGILEVLGNQGKPLFPGGLGNPSDIGGLQNVVVPWSYAVSKS